MAAATWIARAVFRRSRGKLAQLRTLPNNFKALRVRVPSLLLCDQEIVRFQGTKIT